MSQFNVVRRCYGCGAVLQSEDPKAKGYLGHEVLENGPLGAPLFCEECWKTTRYNSAPSGAKASDDFLSMLRDARASDALIVYVVNLFSFECSFIPEVNEILGESKILVIANKRDLLPKKADDGWLRSYVAGHFRKSKLNVGKDDVYLLSLRSAMDISDVVKKIDAARKGHDVYVIGAAGAGKTVFVNAYLRGYANRSNRNVSIAKYPKTSLNVMTIPLDSSSSLFDTPGTSPENSLLSKVGPMQLHGLVPQMEIKPRQYALAEKEKLVFGEGLATVTLTKGKRTALTVYCSNDLPIAKRLGNKLEDAFFKLVRQIGNAPKEISPSDFDAFDIDVEETGQRDIGIEGLGWFSFPASGQSFRLYVRKGVSLYISTPKIKAKR